MLEIKLQGKIVEKIVRTRTGQLVRAVFFVVESDGGLDVRLLSAVPVPKTEGFATQDSRFKRGAIFLAGKCQKSPAVTSGCDIYHAVVSPFFNKFQFLVSQPTRAPSLY